MARNLITFITPAAGKWMTVTRFDKEIRAILYDPKTPDRPEPEEKEEKEEKEEDPIKKMYEKDPLLFKSNDVPSLKILGWPNGLGMRKLRWTEFVPDLEAAKLEMVVDRKTGITKKKYSEGFKTFLDSQMIIGTREEWVSYLNKVETHPAVVEITSVDGGSVEMVLNIAIEVLHPILTRRVEDFIGYGTSFVIEAFRLWGATKTFKELRSVCTEDDKTIHDEIFDKLTPLNQGDFVRKGFWVNRVAVMAIAIAERSKDLLESEEKITKEANNAKAAVGMRDAEIRLNEAQEARNTTELNFRKADAKIKLNLIKESADGIAKMNKGWGEGGLTRLILSGGNHNAMQTIVEGTIEAKDFADDDTDERRKPKPDSKKKGGTDHV